MTLVIVLLALPMIVSLLASNDRILKTLLFVYIVAVLFITIGSRYTVVETHVVMNPFHVYRVAYLSISEGVRAYGWKQVLVRIKWYRDQFNSLGLNILLFVPLGYLVPSIFFKFDRWWKMFLIGCLFSILIEMIQLLTKCGWFDTSDILHNSIGVMLGWIVFVKIIGKKRFEDMQ